MTETFSPCGAPEPLASSETSDGLSPMRAFSKWAPHVSELKLSLPQEDHPASLEPQGFAKFREPTMEVPREVVDRCLNDIFGIPLFYHLKVGRQKLTEKEQIEYGKQKEVILFDIFRKISEIIGEGNTQELFVKASRRSKRGKGKALRVDKDTRLLEAYDKYINDMSIPKIAKMLREQGADLGNTEAAIRAQMRRLVLDREKEGSALVRDTVIEIVDREKGTVRRVWREMAGFPRRAKLVTKEYPLFSNSK